MLDYDIDKRIYDALAEGPTGLTALWRKCGSHYYVIRRHVDSMIRRGIVRRDGWIYAICGEYVPDINGSRAIALEIARIEGGITVQTLADEAGISKQGASQTLRRLERDGVLARVAGDEIRELSVWVRRDCFDNAEPLEGLD